MISLSSRYSFWEARSGFLRFFNLYDKSQPENQTKWGEIDLFRTISKVLIYVLESFSLRFWFEKKCVQIGQITPLLLPLLLSHNLPTPRVH